MNERQTILEKNRRAWQQMARKGHRLTKTVPEEKLGNPLAQVDAPGWLGGDISGWQVLCLAAGGGKHGALYRAAGARVTVVDLCTDMLDLDREVQRRTGLDYQLIETSMDDLRMLPTGTFDLVIHPVSTCYLPKLQPVFSEVARVTKPGGLYISQHKQPSSLQASAVQRAGEYTLSTAYYSEQPLPSGAPGDLVREPEATEFIHRWETLIGGMCRAGFVIEDLLEPYHADPAAKPGTFEHRSCFLPPYVRVKARRVPAINPAVVQPALLIGS